MTKLQQAAALILDGIAYDISLGAKLWPEVNRLERRFKLVGRCEYLLAKWEAERNAWVKAWIERNVPWENRWENYAH